METTGQPSPRHGEPSAAPVSRVSVVIPTFRDRGYIDAALASVRRNAQPGDQIIVAANGSPAEYVARLRTMESEMVRVLDLPTPGVSHARNAGLAAATGEFVVFLDDDDELADGGLAALRELLQAHPEWMAVAGEIERFGDGGVQRGDSYYRGPHRIDVLRLLGASITSPGAAVMRTTFAREIGGFAAEASPCEDLDLWLRVAERGQLMGVPVRTLRYRVHAQAISRHVTPMARKALALFQSRIVRFPFMQHAHARRSSSVVFTGYYIPLLQQTLRSELRTGHMAAALRTAGVLLAFVRIRATARVLAKLWLSRTPTGANPAAL